MVYRRLSKRLLEMRAMTRPREATLETLERELAAAPQALELRYRRAGILAALGRFDAARADYLAVLAAAPAHLGALNDLGTLLHTTGYLAAARTCYGEAVGRHPGAPLPRVNLANMLLDENDAAAARGHYEAALALAPDLAEAHQGLARCLAESGDDAAAARHRALGFRDRAVVARPWYGTGDGVRLLLLVASAGGNVPTRFLIDESVYRTTVLVADFCAGPLPPHELAFNAIGDADLAGAALEAAEKLLARTPAPVVNPPRVVLATGRTATAARMANIPGVAAPRAKTFARDALAQDGAARLRRDGFEFPLLLRRPGFHTGRFFVRVEGPQDIEAALAALPGAELTAISFLDGRGADGLVRKYRVMAVGGHLYPMHLAIASDWKVHYFTSGMAERADHRAEEARFLADMPGAIGRPAVAALERIAERLGLDYGGIDFGLGRDGKVLLFEANATMVVNPPEPDPRWDYRRAAVTRVRDAVGALLSRRADAARLPHGQFTCRDATAGLSA